MKRLHVCMNINIDYLENGLIDWFMFLNWSLKSHRSSYSSHRVHWSQQFLNMIHIKRDCPLVQDKVDKGGVHDFRREIIGKEDKAVVRIRIRWIRKILASWIRIRKIWRPTDSDPRGKISINQKLSRSLLFSKPKSKLLEKKRDHINFLISEWFIKKQQKNNNLKILLCSNKILVSLKEMFIVHCSWEWSRSFFQCGSRIRIK